MARNITGITIRRMDKRGEFCVVPHGTEHRTSAVAEAEILVFEPAQTRNTGNVSDARFTAPNGVKI